jgi:hypothetical protein
MTRISIDLTSREVPAEFKAESGSITVDNHYVRLEVLDGLEHVVEV